ncbi:TrkH family potassium uptake protein [Parvimonas parva]|uniref:TrkH family potassium uptake protein n=1 Tax=Parvimonas parva TaxID=2769485 RepID=A0ABS1C8D8_9FIRM|nr:TrkH family potassium uptake protein [Parvimonas parva]MBK1468372.1 TrkH family potassium uptake protein [Parvimonas parva]
MNNKIIRYILSKILYIEAGFLLLPVIVSFIYKENYSNILSFLVTMFLLLLSGYLLGYKSDASGAFYEKEGFIIVSLSWILLSAFGALPFVFSGSIPNFIDAFFETSSGFTTTGASILTNVEEISHSILFWRSFTHLIGGMGILVFALAILPRSNRNSHIMKAEVPGPVFGKFVAKMSYTARLLYKIYFAMTGILIIVLILVGHPIFDSFVHAFGAAGTGGFGIKANSIAYYNSSAVEMILATAMIIFGINFNLYYVILIGKARDGFKSEELRWYLLIVFGSVVLIFFNIRHNYTSYLTAIKDIFFTVSSIISTTGYATVDFGKWPTFSRAILLFLMFTGACAGSTAGGLKISRFIILVKSSILQVRKAINPKRVLSIKVDNKLVGNEVVEEVKSYFVIYIFLVIIFTILISFTVPDFTTAFSAVMATFNNIGPGLGIVGPTGNYASLTYFNKIVLSLAMLAGRLEIFPILVLFSSTTWKKK